MSPTTNTQKSVTQADIDHARDHLARTKFKLGNALSRSIMSSRQAAVDADELKACEDVAKAAERDFTTLCERFVTPQAQDTAPAVETSGAPRLTDDLFLDGLERHIASVIVTGQKIVVSGEDTRRLEVILRWCQPGSLRHNRATAILAHNAAATADDGDSVLKDAPAGHIDAGGIV